MVPIKEFIPLPGCATECDACIPTIIEDSRAIKISVRLNGQM